MGTFKNKAPPAMTEILQTSGRANKLNKIAAAKTVQ